MQVLRNNWLALLVIILFVWLMFKPAGCGPTPSWMQKGRDTIKIETNTVRELQPMIYGVPQDGTLVSSQKPVYIPTPYQVGVAESTYNGLLRQYEELAGRFQRLTNDYLAVNQYKDSISLKDSTGQWVGVVNLDQKVTENKLETITPSYQLAFPHTTTTITIREPYNPRNQVYIGGGISGNRSSPVNGAFGQLQFKNKKDRVYQLQGGFLHNGNNFTEQFSIGTLWKIGKK